MAIFQHARNPQMIDTRTHDQRVAEMDDYDRAETARRRADARMVAARAVWLVDAVILILLGFRFIFALLGANPFNSFANFIYTASHPFVAPFFSLFRYNVVQSGVSRFEIYTLVAILFYALVAYLIVRLLTIDRPARRARV